MSHTPTDPAGAGSVGRSEFVDGNGDRTRISELDGAGEGASVVRDVFAAH